ncbi:hypothetical protein GGI43DRAFT_287322 [Trichoderma evansii]
MQRWSKAILHSRIFSPLKILQILFLPLEQWPGTCLLCLMHMHSLHIAHRQVCCKASQKLIFLPICTLDLWQRTSQPS